MRYFNKKAIAPLSIVLISLLVIFCNFGRIPQKIAFDELEFARLSLSLNNKFLLFSPLATGHATPYFYLILLSLKNFGLNIFALRLVSAIFGVLNGFLVFKLLNQFFETKFAYLGALVFVTSHWVLNFARFGFEATYLLFWELVSILGVLYYLKTKQKKYFWLSLFSAIGAFYSYLPGRIFWLLPILLLIINQTKMKLIVIYILGILLFSLPLLFASGSVEYRVQTLSYINSEVPILTKLDYFGQNVNKNLLMLNVQGDLNGKHNYPGKPALNIILGILFWIGLIVSLKKWRKYRLFYLWIILTIVPTFFTYPWENPHFLRTYSMTVSIVFLVTLALAYLVEKRKISYFLIVCLVILSGCYELRTYFKYQKKVFPKAFEKTKIDLDNLKIEKNLNKF